MLFFDAAYLLALVPDRLVLISNVSEDTLTRGSLAVRLVDTQVLCLLAFSVDFGRWVHTFLYGWPKDALALNRAYHRLRLAFYLSMFRGLNLFTVADHVNSAITGRILQLGSLLCLLEWLLLLSDRGLCCFVYVDWWEGEPLCASWWVISTFAITVQQVTVHAPLLLTKIECSNAIEYLFERFVSGIRGEFLRVDIWGPFDQHWQFMGELVVEIDLAVLAPHALERLELHDKLPVGVEHLALCLNQGPSVVILPTVKNWRRLIINGGKLEGLVDLLFEYFII